MIRSVLSLILLISVEAFADHAVEISYEGIAHSGPMAIDAVVNNWDGKIQNEDDGFLWLESTAGFRVSSWSLSYVRRFHAEYRFPWELSEGFYYATNDIELDSEYVAYSYMDARDYRGEGWETAYSFAINPQLTITPKLTWLVIDRLIWGTVDGEVRYTSPDEFGASLMIDYGYTDDKILRRSLERKYYGDLYAFGLEAGWQHNKYTVNYRGENLLASIHWQDLPYTDAIADTEGFYLIDGYEYYEDTKLTPSSIHWLDQRWQFNERHAANLQLLVTGIQTTARFDYVRSCEYFDLSAGYHPQWRAVSLGITSPYFGLSLMSDSLDVDKSRTLAVNASVAVIF